jgi:hypothetical protein
MAAGKYNMTIEQGSTLNLQLLYKDSNNAIIDLSGYSAKMQIKSDFADNSPTTYLTLSSSVGSGLTITPVSGTIDVLIPAESSSLMTFDTAYYDLEITTGSIVTRVLQGTVKISKQVTT